jgi:hypothetical protein
VEELRPLSTLELNLRRLIIKFLQRLIKERIAFWTQRSKIRFAIDGDENSKYFHAIVTDKYRNNKIASIVSNGSVFTSYENKLEILTNYYKQLLSHAFQPNWNFQIQKLYPTHVPGLY